jgi:lipopolysaccharide exporter
MKLVSTTFESIKRRLSKLLDSNSLKARVFRGSALLGSASVLEQTFRFGRNILLARLLAPEAFGTMAIILSTTSVLQSLTDVGAREALIQNPRGTEDGHIGAAWWLAIGRSASLYFLVFILAPVIARFYGNTELVPLLRVAATGVLFEGAISSRAYVAIKEMKFRIWATIYHGGGILGVLFTIFLSFFIRDVWALVLGFASENAVRCILSFAICPFWPSLKWDMLAFRDLLKFSRGLFGLSLLNLIFARTDIFILGKLYSTTDLGLYAMAIYLAQTPAGFLVNLLNHTLLSTFSHVRGNDSRLNRILIQVSAFVALLGMPLLVFLFFCGHSVLAFVYGSRYGAASSALTVAACVAFLNVANSQITMVFYSKGMPQLHRRSVAIMAVLMLVLAFPFIKVFGIVGGQLACFVSVVIGYAFQIERVTKLTGLDLFSYGKSFANSAIVSLGVVVICLLSRSLGIMNRPIPNILVGLVACLIGYGFAAAILHRTEGRVA